LRVVHLTCRSKLLRRIMPKLDALATMIQQERETYYQWLNNSDLVWRTLNGYFPRHTSKTGWGKIRFSGLLDSVP
jgi:hypothetical protein